ncbi:MAG: RNA polymerase sigma factor [Chitinophagaceae bacterium]
MEDMQKLVKECLRNNASAQKQLYDIYDGKMIAVCYRYTKNMEDAKDVLQEGFIKVFKNLHQYRLEGELGAWIRKVMVNTAINYLKRKPAYQQELSYTDTSLHPVSDNTPEIKINTRDLISLIRQLPTGYQLIFNLYAVEGYSHAEIASMLGIVETTSRSQYVRARNLLIKWIENNSLTEQKDNYAG